MYSGITQGLYPVVSLDKQDGLLAYSVRLREDLLANLKIGDSIAVDGVCQSVVAISKDEVSFQAINETLRRTTLSNLRLNSLVSIERSLRYGDEVGGHEVSGHVFGTGVIVERLKTHDSLTLVIHCNPDWMKYILTKGFVAIDGSSLTVGDTDFDKGLFTLHLIPETLRLTNFNNKKINDKVNIEFDYKTKTIVDTVTRILKDIRLIGN